MDRVPVGIADQGAAAGEGAECRGRGLQQSGDQVLSRLAGHEVATCQLAMGPGASHHLLYGACVAGVGRSMQASHGLVLASPRSRMRDKRPVRLSRWYLMSRSSTWELQGRIVAFSLMGAR
ncbi:hypothetical protein HaLaN_07490 [Haematococcus lacustris]|uniref:Uncharacterized protein n=1 Tax=Haematococcus lacustris TaxID=44745 RepID=A0A699YWE5_HAELA|nr:hypothetical protein HaLaN_07490 [Haematococcus lacustris]